MAEFERLGARAWRDAMYRGDPSRADAKLRSFARKVGEATMCPRCDGDGLILRKAEWIGLTQIIEPIKCPDCGGEGLDPNVQQGGK